MKKFISLLMVVFCVATFSMSALAESTEIQPRSEVCPLCGHGSLVEVRGTGGRTSPRFEHCIHGKLGYDEYLDYYGYYYIKCTNGACGYTAESGERRYRSDFVRCGGI